MLSINQSMLNLLTASLMVRHSSDKSEAPGAMHGMNGCSPCSSKGSADPLQARCQPVMAYKFLHARAPSYLGPFVRVADVSGRRAIRSAGTNRILVPPVTSTTVGSQAFSIYPTTLSPLSLPTFQRKLKRHLFCQSFPGFCY